MDGLQDLYQELILDHNARPRNFGPLAEATHHAEGYNPTCGDQITVHMVVEGDVIQKLCFEGKGCAISKASASLMTEKLQGLGLADAQGVFGAFHTLLAGAQDADSASDDRLGKLLAFSGVRAFPMRVKCATLAWHTLQAALKNAPARVEITHA